MIRLYTAYRLCVALAFVSLAVPVVTSAQSNALSFTSIPFTDADMNRPAGGVELWNGLNLINIPLSSTNSTRIDKYYRFNWVDIETGNGVYSWTKFDAQINAAITANQKFGFGIMGHCEACNTGVSTGGAQMAYPLYLHNQMMGETVKPFTFNGNWTPNWNSEFYLSALERLNTAINTHLMTGSFNGVAYKNVINYIDIRGFGSYGEWHNYPYLDGQPSANNVTTTSLRRIIDAHKNKFPDFQLVAMIAGFDPGGWSNMPAEISYYLLTASNNVGQFGWRRDSWGDPATWYPAQLENNPTVYQGARIKDLIMNKWQFAPIVGEPMQCCTAAGGSCAYWQLEDQVRRYHVSSFGNGNLESTATCAATNVRNASKAAGYRIVLTGGSLSSTITSGTSFPLTLNWQNTGIAPVYEKWNVTYELKNALGAVVWTGNSNFNLRLFLPASAATPHTDNLTIPTSVPAGAYTMTVKIKDANGFRSQPFPLAISGRNSDGSYTLKSITITTGTGGSTNEPPIANAGADQNVILPLALVTLNGSASSDPDGTIASYSWAKVSGPSVLSILTAGNVITIVNSLISGSYVFRLTVTDDDGATATDDVTINVAGLINQPPVANAGTNVSLTLPINSTTLNGTGSSDPDGSIATYAWTRVSGPTTYTIANAASATTGLSNLVQGTYVFRLTVTDNAGATNTSNVTVTVNAAANQPPVANAGANLTITLPSNSTTLNGSGSSDPDGSIATYAWSRVSGPTTYTLGNASAVSTTLSGLVAGTYVFRLTVTDNDGATSTDNINVNVNAAANQPPVAEAGANITLNLPANSTTLNGGGSSDPDGSIAIYAWTRVSGPTTFTLVNAGAVSTALSNLTAGTYVFRLTVTDDDGATATDNITVTVNAAANQSPVAAAGANISITLPVNSTTLNGSGSSDPDGSIATYAWTRVSGPTTFTLANAGAATTAISNLVAGTYTFRLTVTDDDGATSTDDVSVIVNAAANQPPVANAGTNISITLPVSATTLNGGGSSDPDGSIATYAWTRVSGPTGYTITNAAAVSTAISNLVEGTYMFRLTVTDNKGATSTDDVTIIVNAAAGPANQAPIANAGNNVTLMLPANSTTLNGSGSIDEDGTVNSYLWERLSGPATLTFANAHASVTNLSNLVVGTYIIRLTVTDNDGASATDNITVTVVPQSNQAPTANAGPNVTLTLPANSTSLNGSASSDADGTIVTYAWTKVSGPAGNNIANPGNVSTAITTLVQGVYVFRLTVTDNDGATSTDDVTITVNSRTNLAPVANAGSNVTIVLPTNSTTLNGGASNDADGTIATYAWSKVSGPAGNNIANPGNVSTAITSLLQGVYIFRLTVTDNDGATSTDDVTVTVNAPTNLAPVANAGSNVTITLPTNSTTLSGSASSDPDGSIATYAWTKVSGPAGNNIANPGNITTAITTLVQGVYVFRLTVTDNDGASASANVTVTVKAIANTPPVANAGPNVTITLPTNSTTVNGGLSTDANGTIVTYAWSKVSGPAGTNIANPAGVSSALTSLLQGVYVFRLTVTDNSGATASDDVSVTVNAAVAPPVPANIPPVAMAGTDKAVTLSSNNTTLDGSASHDDDGTINIWDWKQVSGPGVTTFSATNTAVVTISDMIAGDYVYVLTVTDNRAGKSTDTIRVTVVDNFRNDSWLMAYPNPTVDVLKVRLVDHAAGDIMINIYDVTGKRAVTPVITTKPAGAYTTSVDVSKLTPGTYIVEVTMDHKRLTSKIVKQ